MRLHNKWENMKIYYASLENWKTRRKDKKMEAYWISREKLGKLNPYEEYQKKWNFRETDYSEKPSNNGLDMANPGFAFTTNLAKYIKIKTYETES